MISDRTDGYQLFDKIPESRAGMIPANQYLFPIPEFNGNDPQTWLSQANLYFKKSPMDTVEEWDTFEKVKYARYFMFGAAEIWFVETFTDEPKETWESFCEKVLHQFTNPLEKKQREAVARLDATLDDSSNAEEALDLMLNRGPGCSSLDDFIYENGPFNFEVAKEGEELPVLHLNPYSWSKVSSINYLDFPVGVGFSYSLDMPFFESGDSQTATDTHHFLLEWFEQFPEFITNSFYISGESYAGVDVPTLATEVHKGIRSGIKPVIKLKGYMVGNGVCDRDLQGNALVPFAHEMGLISDNMFRETEHPFKGILSGLPKPGSSEFGKFYSLTALNDPRIDKLPYSIRILLENVKPNHLSTAVLMTAAGVLWATNRSRTSGFLHLKNCAEDRIEMVAKDLVTQVKGFVSGNDILLQCIALALARTGSFSYRSSTFRCIAHALLAEIFPLRNIFNRILKIPEENLAVVLDEIKRHSNSAIFKEAGAVTGVFCNMYSTADENSRTIVENLIWDFCQDVYLLHRQTKLVLHGKGEDIIKEIEKIAESAFHMVVVFALGVSKHKFDSRIINQETRLQTSVRILVSFSCMEYFRRMRLPEYMDTIRVVITSLQENESACISFAESVPSYDDLTKNLGSSSSSNVGYLWANDEVQTARIVSYMRVIPTCIEHISASIFEKEVAPTMFLYMGHPNSKVVRYSHSMFVAFISSGKDATCEERVLLKEKLVFYYVQRSLEGYPGITPFEGMAPGVAALVRHLPAGSPSTFFCIHSLVEKAESLNSHDTDLSKSWDEESEPFSKLLDLLQHLLALVDIQILPSLMKLLAQLIIELPVDSQNLLKYIAISLGLDCNIFEEMFGESVQAACPKPDLVLGLSPHSNGSVLTVLQQGKGNFVGLQILKDSNWITLQPVLNALVINFGDTIGSIYGLNVGDLELVASYFRVWDPGGEYSCAKISKGLMVLADHNLEDKVIFKREALSCPLFSVSIYLKRALVLLVGFQCGIWQMRS